MYDSMNALLKTMESMKSDVSGVKGGLANLHDQRVEPSVPQRKRIRRSRHRRLYVCRQSPDQTTVMIPRVATDGARCGDGY